MPKNLLLADDSITIQKVVGITFANEDYKVTSVDNGEDAIARARDLKPDVILADVVMPKKNGYEVCEAVKSDPSLKHIPVLLLAGTFEAFDEARARAARADGHIGKPFESQALINKVNELVTGKPSAPAPGAPAPRPAAPAPAPRPAMPGAPAAGAPPRPAAPPPGVQPRPGAPMPPAAAPRPPGATAAGMAPPGVPPRPGAPAPAGARPPGAPMPPGVRPPGPPQPPGARPPGAPPPGARPPGPPMPPGARPPGAPPHAAAPGAQPRPGAPMQPAARPPAPAARPAPAPAAPPRPAAPPQRAAPPQPARAKDPFGFGAEAAPPAATPHDDDWSDVAVAPAGPAPVEAIDLGGEPEAAPELAPMHEFVPPAASTGHAPEAKAAAPGDGGEAALRAALSAASREVIERIVWEVVPQLAETIIRENLDRLTKNRQG